MEANVARKCENCGGALQAVDADTLKCPYCGCTYSIKSKEKPAAAGDGPVANPHGFAGSGGSGPGSNNGLAKILLFFFLVIVGIVVVAVIINVGRAGRPAYSSYADSLIGDTANTDLKILTDDEQKEAHEPHIKKTFPDPEIVITKHRIGMIDDTKAITIGYRNKSKHDILHADFTIRLFDGQGREITVPDSEKTIKVYGRTSPGESQSDSWARGKEMARAKTVKVTLKKVALDSVVWDY